MSNYKRLIQTSLIAVSLMKLCGMSRKEAETAFLQLAIEQNIDICVGDMNMIFNQLNFNK